MLHEVMSYEPNAWTNVLCHDVSIHIVLLAVKTLSFWDFSSQILTMVCAEWLGILLMTIFLCSICQRTRDEQVMNKSRAAMSKPIRSYNRVPHNTVSIFVLLISWHLEVPSLTFFNSSFNVDFKTLQFVILWWTLDQVIAKILEGSHFKN